MKRILCIAITSMVLVSSIVSCGSSANPATPVPADIPLRQTQVALQQTEVAIQQTQAALQHAATQNGRSVSETPSTTVSKQGASSAASPTSAPLPTETPMPPPTRTPTLAPTPTWTPTLVPPPQFADNFNGGLLPDWLPVLGQVGTVNGKMTLVDVSLSQSGVIAIGGSEWDNFAIEFEVSNLKDDEECTQDLKCYAPKGGMNEYPEYIFSQHDTWGSRMAILINIDPKPVKKPGSSEGFIVGESHIGWGTLDLSQNDNYSKLQGQWTAIPGGGLVDATKMPQPRHFRIEKRGQNYLVLYDGQLISQYSARLPAGKLGVWFGKLNKWDDANAVPMVDNFEIKPLP